MKTKGKGTKKLEIPSAKASLLKAAPRRRARGKLLLFALALLAIGLSSVKMGACLRRKVRSHIASQQQLTAVHVLNVGGGLRRDDIIQLLRLPAQPNLTEIDVRHCRRLLLHCPQIAGAQVELIHPHELRVRVVERVPQFRLMPSEGCPPPVVAADGVVFAGKGLDPEALRKLPILRGWGAEEKNLPFIPELSQALREANRINPSLVATWLAFTVTREDFTPAGKLECFEVQSLAIQRIRLRSDNLPQQLEELAFILDGARRRRQLPIARVDLTVAGRAFVKPLTHPLNGARSIGE
jgi:cell division septal protein FtsQ